MRTTNFPDKMLPIAVIFNDCSLALLFMLVILPVLSMLSSCRSVSLTSNLLVQFVCRLDNSVNRENGKRYKTMQIGDDL